MTRIPYPRWPDPCLYAHAPYFRLHWPSVQGKMWCLSPALNVLAELGPIAGELEGTWQYGTRIQYGFGYWWRYYMTEWAGHARYDQLWLTFYCLPESDRVILRSSARLDDEDGIPLAAGWTDAEYLGENTKNEVPWTQPTHIVLKHLWGTPVGELTISPVWPPDRWPKIPEKQLGNTA